MTEKNSYPESLKSVVLMTVAKSGAWALLSFMLLFAIGFEADKLLGDYVKSQKDYINASIKNAENLEKTIHAMSDTMETNSLQIGMLQQMMNQQASVADASATILREAQTHMREVPQRSQRQLEAIQRIEKILADMEKASAGIDPQG